jgi:hypothetical protein
LTEKQWARLSNVCFKILSRNLRGRNVKVRPRDAGQE